MESTLWTQIKETQHNTLLWEVYAGVCVCMCVHAYRSLNEPYGYGHASFTCSQRADIALDTIVIMVIIIIIPVYRKEQEEKQQRWELVALLFNYYYCCIRLRWPFLLLPSSYILLFLLLSFIYSFFFVKTWSCISDSYVVLLPFWYELIVYLYVVFFRYLFRIQYKLKFVYR